MVVDNQQRPVPDTSVVVVPDSQRGLRSDLYRTASTDHSGRVHLEGISPGEYWIFAWEDVEDGAWQDRDFLRMYEDRATVVHLTDSAKENLVLRVIPQDAR
jgi:hypothetical protein